jgi:hypothetical protein
MKKSRIFDHPKSLIKMLASRIGTKLYPSTEIVCRNPLKILTHKNYIFDSKSFPFIVSTKHPTVRVKKITVNISWVSSSDRLEQISEKVMK